MTSQSPSEVLKAPSLFESVTSANPKPVPAPPQEILDYRTLSTYQQDKVKDELFNKDHIKEYLETKWRAELHNRDAILWLVDFRNNHMDKDNAVQAKAVEVKLRQFLTAIGDQNAIYPALKIDLKELGIANIKTTSDAVAWDD